MSKRLRIYLTGVGGQGTLTATTLLSRIALDQGLDVVSGEIHGMAQRGGVVESTVLVGGWQSPTIAHGQADILLGFEALETLRGLSYLTQSPKGYIFSSSEIQPPQSVFTGKASMPHFDEIQKQAVAAAEKTWFLPIRTIGIECGAVQSGNTALLAAFCASGLAPFDVKALEDGVKKYMPAKVVDVNLAAIARGIAAIK